MKMRSMAENADKMELGRATEPYFPGFSVTEKQLPEAASWKDGEEYTVVLKVKMSGHQAADRGRPARFDFKMLAVGAEKKKASSEK